MDLIEVCINTLKQAFNLHLNGKIKQGKDCQVSPMSCTMVWNAKMNVFLFELGENPNFDAMQSECPIYTKGNHLFGCIIV